MVNWSFTVSLRECDAPKNGRHFLQIQEFELTVLTIFEPMVLAAVFALVRTTLAAPTARMITPEANATHSRVTRPSSSAKKRNTRENISIRS